MAQNKSNHVGAFKFCWQQRRYEYKKIGKVTSGPVAKITNVGTPTAAILDFVLPKGDTGEGATIDEVKLEIIGDDEAASVENYGSPQHAKFLFRLPASSASTGNVLEIIPWVSTVNYPPSYPVHLRTYNETEKKYSLWLRTKTALPDAGAGQLIYIHPEDDLNFVYYEPFNGKSSESSNNGVGNTNVEHIEQRFKLSDIVDGILTLDYEAVSVAQVIWGPQDLYPINRKNLADAYNYEFTIPTNKLTHNQIRFEGDLPLADEGYVSYYRNLSLDTDGTPVLLYQQRSELVILAYVDSDTFLLRDENDLPVLADRIISVRIESENHSRVVMPSYVPQENIQHVAGSDTVTIANESLQTGDYLIFDVTVIDPHTEEIAHLMLPLQQGKAPLTTGRWFLSTSGSAPEWVFIPTSNNTNNPYPLGMTDGAVFSNDPNFFSI